MMPAMRSGKLIGMAVAGCLAALAPPAVATADVFVGSSSTDDGSVTDSHFTLRGDDAPNVISIDEGTRGELAPDAAGRLVEKPCGFEVRQCRLVIKSNTRIGPGPGCDFDGSEFQATCRYLSPRGSERQKQAWTGDIDLGGGSDAITIVQNFGSSQPYSAIPWRWNIFYGAGNDVIPGGLLEVPDLNPSAEIHVGGGAGDDTFVGRFDTRPFVLYGGGVEPSRETTGDDTFSGISGSGGIAIFGGGGNDTVSLRAPAKVDGGPGNDTITGSPGADRLDGGPGDDVIDGRDGPDRVLGGAGADMIKVADSSPAAETDDTVDAGPGADTIDAKDGRRDTIACGTSSHTVMTTFFGKPATFQAPDEDRVRLDLTDAETSDCENVTREARAEPAAPKISIASRRLGADGSVLVRLRCPARPRRGCAGRAQARTVTGRARRRVRPPTGHTARRYRIRRNASERLALPLTSRQRARLRRAGYAHVRVTVVEPDSTGRPRTRQQTFLVRA